MEKLKRYLGPSLIGLVICVVIGLPWWSYTSWVVKYVDIKVEQIGTRIEGGFVTLRLTKLVSWGRLCTGYAEQEIRPSIAVDNPKKISSTVIKLDGHVINTPRHKGPNNQKGDPIPERYLVLTSGTVSPGHWRYKICSYMACMPWEYLKPIESDCAEADFDIN
jgi:hypothetical protein